MRNPKEIIATPGSGFVPPQTQSEVKRGPKPPTMKSYDAGWVCVKEKFDPVLELIQMFRGETDTDQKIDICKTILGYIAPKVRSIVISGEVNLTHEQVIKSLLSGPHPVRKEIIDVEPNE